MARRVLIVVTSHAQLGTTGQKTGLWLEELAAPYNAFRAAGVEVDIASPQGGRPPIDPKSDAPNSDAKPGEAKGEVATFLADADAREKLDNTLKLADVEVRAGYDAVFVAGGHGVMWDLPRDERLQALLATTFDQGDVVAAVCHGPAALVGVKLASGQLLVAGRKVAGFSDEEEKAVGLDRAVPFLLEAKLKELGGKYERGPIWAPFAVSDGKLVTGQNPASSKLVAQQVLAAFDQ
jgi:putative intracellular protease/amidase